MPRNKLLYFAIFGLALVLPLKFFTSVINASTTIPVNFTVSSPTESTQSYPLGINRPIYGLFISGNISLNGETSLVRIILIDSNQNEHLVYETYPLIVDNSAFSINNACEEACALDSVTPVSLRIDMDNSSVQINSLSFLDNSEELSLETKRIGISSAKKNQKLQKDKAKIKKMNQQIKKKDMKWIAGETSVSRLSYTEKKKLFSNPDGTPVDKLPNLQGFEYYKGGIFEIKTDKGKDLVKGVTAISSGLPKSWDWRNVHGENWNTSVRSQIGGTCWAHARIGAMESQINLYFNQHPNINLSEQMLVDCNEYSERPIGMGMGAYPECRCQGVNLNAYDLYCITGIHGLPDENCDPYVGREYPQGPVEEWFCTSEYICPDWQERIWRNTHSLRLTDDSSVLICPNTLLVLEDDELKRLIITMGPMDGGIRFAIPDFPPHSMVLGGYETDFEDNQTVWVFKNSWGPSWGDNGYAKIKTSLPFMLNGTRLPKGPFIPPPDTSYWPAGFTGEIRCVDQDGDGYCNWGISEEKPASCSVSCRPEKDCDDSDPNLGPFDENFNCLSLLPPDPCDADLDGDGDVDQSDAKILLNSWLSSSPGDFNLDSKVNSLDFGTMASLWGQTCTPSPTPTP